MSHRNEFYILSRIKGTEASVRKDIDYLNKHAELMNRLLGDNTITIYGIGITKSAMMNKFVDGEYVINRNQLYVLLRNNNMDETNTFLYEQVTDEKGTYYTIPVDYLLFCHDEDDMISLDKLVRNGLYKKVQNNHIEWEIVKELLDTRKQRNRYERSTN